MDNVIVYRKIEEMCKNNVNYLDAINTIIEFGRKNISSSDWDEIRKVNHQQIMDDFDNSFKMLIEKIKVNEINGLYFGFTTISLDGTIQNGSYLVEIGGTNKCIINDQNYEWAFDCEWYPSEIEFYSSEFDILYKIISKENGLRNNAEYGIGLAFTVVLINSLIRKYENSIKRKIGVVAGFHDGDMIKLKGFNE